MSDTSTGRRYRMTRLAAGDYLCLSNDGASVWRFHHHRDGRRYGLEVDYDDRLFWRAAWMPRPDFNRVQANPDALDDPWSGVWREAGWYLPTRAACVDLMLRTGAAR